ncbi:MAG: Rab family GTPase [Candidatus Korarchaeota archaeon]
MALYEFKVVIAGEPAVGKTSLVTKACGGECPKVYLMTIGVNIASWQKMFDADVIVLSIWDLGGQDRFLRIHPDFFKGAHAIVLCFDLTDPESLEKLKSKWWEKEVKDASPLISPNVKYYLIGTKSDLMQKVDDSKIMEFSKEIPNVCFMKTSALKGENVNALFEKIAMDLKAQLKS